MQKGGLFILIKESYVKGRTVSWESSQSPKFGGVLGPCMGWMVLQGRRVLCISKGVLWGWLVLKHTGLICKKRETTRNPKAN